MRCDAMRLAGTSGSFCQKEKNEFLRDDDEVQPLKHFAQRLFFVPDAVHNLAAFTDLHPRTDGWMNEWMVSSRCVQVFHLPA